MRHATYVAALYSVVLPGGERLKMADLKALATALGLREPRTVGSSGNLLFQSRVASPAVLERLLEEGFGERFGKAMPIIVRPARAFSVLAAGSPFAETHDPRLISVRLMREGYPPGVVEDLQRYVDDEQIAVCGGDLWIAFQRDPGKSRLMSAFSTRKFATPGTFRTFAMIARINSALDDVA